MHLQKSTWLLTVAIFECLCNSVTSTTSHSPLKEPATKEILDKVENSLLSLFGFKGRPKIDRQNIVIPDEMKKLYEMQTGLRWSTPSIPKKGGYLGSANTIRSFIHVVIPPHATYDRTAKVEKHPTFGGFDLVACGADDFLFIRPKIDPYPAVQKLKLDKIADAESPIDERFTTNSKFRLKFDVSIPHMEVLKAAELSLKRYELPIKTTVRIIIEDILKLGVKGEKTAIKRLIDSKQINVGENSTVKLDVTEAVHRWLHDPKSNFGVLVTIKGLDSKYKGHVRLKRSLVKSINDWKRDQPTLYTYTDDPKHSQEKNIRETIRKRRAAKKHLRTKNANTPCSRHKMYVDFSSVGWDDWIVAPPGYDAYYCYGECRWPMPPHLNTTNHAIIQSLMNSVNPLRVPNPCCVPTHLNSISMLYLDDENKVVLKNYKEMVVIGCGCR